ncbi:hypothetical protein [Rathayibacter iranicus]|uniref:Uncharacterized protein n=2 Tax=Rathayibacter iranicus TaxID=59737 RepID=A0AAD1ABR5_9MICO|nr:hypothetical protein [Rathayibacter iranicus]AZZ55307.1 hypothetical protein C7V51_04950 [Rathayibacter iranicus]MWV30969.1 hypothetical protein [Rathayibacter iranicus NCPPB 2253 = VKM Ac-1602]PPI48096.1 hypothetical protein C5E09_04025 [Rathayibacter iranicus]PPI61312.1 hypothetical protein C5E08_04935 [Rathayibacter iranicus]PPI72743.1 hypothetical protein C5E01_05690 [Rathayibacter iranicus]
MQWWNEFMSWIRTGEGYQAIVTAVVVLVAVVIGVVIVASVFRASIARLIRQQEHERKNAIIATLVDAAVDASAWNVLSGPERVLSDRASAQAETHLRLLPVKGSGVAANWAAHELAELKHTSTTGGYQTQASVGEFRDRLVQWRDRPGRARKAFLADLERWRFSETGRERTEDIDWSGVEEERPVATAQSDEPTSRPSSSGLPVDVGAGSSDPGSDSARSSAPTIVLPPAAGDMSEDETSRLLADVDRLDVPSRERFVEELPPIESHRHAPAKDAPEPTRDGDAPDTDGPDAEPIEEIDAATVQTDEARFQPTAPASDRPASSERPSD